MTSIEQNMKRSFSDGQKMLKHAETHNSIPLKSLTITIDHSEKSSILSAQSSTNNIINDEYNSDSKLPMKRRYARTLSIACVSYRLTKRKKLCQRCCQINDIMCVVGLLGIILMIIENEITFMHVDHHDNLASWIIKLIITISTIILIGLVVYYYYFDISLYCINNSIEYWLVALTGRKLGLMILEILLCSIHPIPRHFPIDVYSENKKINSNLTMTNHSTLISISLKYIPVDVALGLPMFGRLYMWCRFITFHSHLVQDASSQTLGYLNRVSIDFSFVIKTYFHQFPTLCLTIFCTIVISIGSWSLRACDFTSVNEHISMLDAIWLFIGPFTTVGYGDLTPATYCARGVATIASTIGVLVAALLTAVVTEKLVLSRWEKYVHNFVLNSELAKQRTHQAANILIYTWKMWYLRKMNKKRSARYITMQRKFFESIYIIKQIKEKQRKLTDNCVGVAELMMIHRETSITIDEIVKQTSTMKLKMENVEKKLDGINHTVQEMYKTLNRLLDKRTS
ncbi:unnamed protein product [Rotaria sordida]|uniref:Calmodulin-binding domain-containing protein n=1 Tax=Rotaria sordida TaxID=392033 RepID=A0A815BBT8_9BILA|nr:unnamed protein product [Rotaria sordida]CAF3899884.1 unnamed protein product [Rotaria sordida]